MITQITERETQLAHYLSEMTKVANNAIEHIKELERQVHEVERQTLERAAVVCESFDDLHPEAAFHRCAAAIRALKESK